MSATELKEDFLTFRGLLDTLECLVDVWCKLTNNEVYHVMKPMEDGIIYTARRLTEFDTDTSESNAIEELERLATMNQEISLQNREYSCPSLGERRIFDCIIDSKIDFIKNGSFSRFTSGGGVGPLAALERLAEVRKKLYSSKSMSELLLSKMEEVVYTLEPKALARSSTVNLANDMAAPINTSQEQENPDSDVLIDFADLTTIAESASSPLSWLQKQDNVHTTDEDDSTVDGGALTPTSTIMSGKPRY